MIFEREIVLDVYGFLPWRRGSVAAWGEYLSGGWEWPNEAREASSCNWTGRYWRFYWRSPISLCFLRFDAWKPAAHTLVMFSTPGASDDSFHREVFAGLARDDAYVAGVHNGRPLSWLQANGSEIWFVGIDEPPLKSYEGGVFIGWDLAADIIDEPDLVPPPSETCPKCFHDIHDPDYCHECGWTSERKRQYPNPLDGGGELSGEDVEYLRKRGRK